MLTNAYVMYSKLTLNIAIRKKDLLSHLEFREHIALYWINPEEFIQDKYDQEIIVSGFKRRRDSSTSTISSVIMEPSLNVSTLGGGKGTRHINDASVAPKGNLKCRLDITQDHLPSEKVSSRSRSALHTQVDRDGIPITDFYLFDLWG